MVSSVYQTTSNQIFAFVIGEDENLYDCHLAGTTWVWEAHGTPAGTTCYLLASTDAAIYDSSTDQIFVFMKCMDGHLWDRHGSGTTWSWYDHGTPTGSPDLSFYPCAVFQPGTGQIFVFITASDGHLYCRNWNGLEWLWSDLGTTPSSKASQSVAAICDPFSSQIYVFVVGGGSLGTGDLYVNEWDGKSWEWKTTGFLSSVGAQALGTQGYLSAVYPPLAGYQPWILANQANGTFPLQAAFLNKSTSTWTWETVGMPAPV